LRALTAGEHRRHLEGMWEGLRVADQVDAAMDRVEAAELDAPFDLGGRDPQLEQLRS
jgi:hypothetical protein